MGGSIQVPNNIEDKTVLKRFLTDLVLGINGNTLVSGNVQEQNAAIVELLQVNPNVDFINIVSKLNELRTDILTYVEDNIETVILQNTEDVALIAEQFGTFYSQALAASWYGLSVKAGGAVAGLEVGSLDPDVTTPGDENSYFRVIADNFIVGRAYEDLTQEEKDYLTANNLPSFGTVYNASKQPVPALVITWDSTAQTYNHYFNGIVNFSNISSVPGFALGSDLPTSLSELTNDVGYSTVTQVNNIVDAVKSRLQSQIDGSITSWFNIGVPTLANYPTSNWDTTDIKNQHLGDLYYDKTSGYAYRFAYEDIVDSPDAGIIYSWIRITDTDITLALSKAADAQATADGKITTFYQTSAPTAEGVGDLWVDTDNDNRMYRWNGTNWVDTTINPANIINTGTTTINGGKITTSTLEANVLKPASSGTTVWSGGALVSQNFDGNPVGNIGTPTTGFRLSSNATGTFDNPNIFGAYIRGSTVDVSTMYSRAPSYPTNLGKVIRFQTNGDVYMPNVGSGFAANRVCSRTESALKLDGWYVAATNYLVAYLQYSINGGGTWTTFKTKTAAAYGYQEAFYIYFSELFDMSLVTDSNIVTFRVTGSSAGTASDILISIYNN